jgi:hypothetical protein
VLKNRGQKEAHHFGGAGAGGVPAMAPNLMFNIDGLLKKVTNSNTFLLFLFTFILIYIFKNQNKKHPQPLC